MSSKLDELNQKHLVLLENMGEKNDLIREQLTLWRCYLKDQAQLREWFRFMDEEKQSLDLDNLKSWKVPEKVKKIKVEMINKILNLERKQNFEFDFSWQSLLVQIPDGENLVANLIESYGSGQFVMDSNGILAFCLFKELHHIKDHISNFQASLKTWLDFLSRIIELEEEFDQVFSSLESVLMEVSMFMEMNSENNEVDEEIHQAFVVSFLVSLN